MSEKNNLPVWNNYQFDCPGCARQFAPFTIRIKRTNGTWYCHRCHNEQNSYRANQASGVTLTNPSDAIRQQPCHTCGQTFGNRRIVTNRNGNLVHYRCPKKKAAA